MFPTISVLRAWHSVVLWTVLLLMIGLSPVPAYAHCAGKHGPGHPHCDDGGGEPPATSDSELVWIKDGIEVANGDGSNITLVLSDATGGPIRDVSWAPGGKEILFTRGEGSNVPGGVYRLPLFDGQIEAAKPRGNFAVGEARLLLASDVGAARWSPTPAPDGNYWIAYVSAGGGAFMLNPATKDSFALLDTPARYAVELTWSRNGSRVAVHTLRPELDRVNEDLVVFALGLDGTGALTADFGVSLLLNNPEILSGSNADILRGDTSNIFKLDWANTDDRLVVDNINNPNSLWILPVPVDDPQTAVANGTQRIGLDDGSGAVAEDPEVARAWPRWSPGDDALVYLRLNAAGVCDVQPTKKGRNGANPRNIVIAALSGAVGSTQQTINCSDEVRLDSDGHTPEWWRGTFPQPALPLPSQ